MKKYGNTEYLLQVYITSANEREKITKDCLTERYIEKIERHRVFVTSIILQVQIRGLESELRKREALGMKELYKFTIVEQKNFTAIVLQESSDFIFSVLVT